MPLTSSNGDQNMGSVGEWVYIVASPNQAMMKYQTSTDVWGYVNQAPDKIEAAGLGIVGTRMYYVSYAPKDGAGVLKYDSATDAWTQGNKIPTTRTLGSSSGEGGASAGVSGDRIYVFGGRYPTSYSVTKGNEYYNTATDTWGTGNQMPSSRWGAGVAASSDGSRMFVAGGRDPPTNYDKLEIYTVATDSWVTGNDMPTTRMYTQATMHGTVMMVSGGEAVPGYAATAVFEAYETTTDSWTTKEALPVARRGIPRGIPFSRQQLIC
jgi:N-acetylneuraminic acid mutarotase